MHRFYLSPDQSKSTPLFLTGREAHHALRVLRLRRGDRVTVLDGAGSELLCDIDQYDRDKVQLTLIERRFVPPLPYEITLLQALPKGKLFESITQKATELGIHRIVPVITERVVATLINNKERALKVEKWRLASIEAIKQCGSAWLPRIEVPMTPDKFLARNEHFDLPLIASLQAEARHPREYLQHPPPTAALSVHLDRAGRRFQSGRSRCYSIRRRVADFARAFGTPHRNRGDLLPFNNELRTPIRKPDARVGLNFGVHGCATDFKVLLGANACYWPGLVEVWIESIDLSGLMELVGLLELIGLIEERTGAGIGPRISSGEMEFEGENFGGKREGSLSPLKLCRVAMKKFLHEGKRIYARTAAGERWVKENAESAIRIG